MLHVVRAPLLRRASSAKRELEPVVLGGVPLPWVDGGLHLGNHIQNSCHGMSQDPKIKRAAFINKNIVLNQEFNFCHPSAKVRMKEIYNLHFTGRVIWDLFSKEALMLETHMEYLCQGYVSPSSTNT